MRQNATLSSVNGYAGREGAVMFDRYQWGPHVGTCGVVEAATRKGGNGTVMVNVHARPGKGRTSN